MAHATRAKTIEDLSQQIESFMVKINSRFDDFERKFLAVSRENAELRDTCCNLAKENLGLKNQLNTLEQYQRNYSVRINNIQLPDAISNDPFKVRDYVFDHAIVPVLRGAVADGALLTLPTAEQTLEVAHQLPGRDDRPKPIIARFLNRNFRALVMQLKKKYATRDPTNNRRQAYTIFEDLTRDSFALFKKLLNDERTESVWSIRGQIRYKLTGNDLVKKVDNVYLPFDSYFT